MTAGPPDRRPGSTVVPATGAVVGAVAGGLVVIPELLTPLALVLVLRRVPGRGWWRRGAVAMAVAAGGAWAAAPVAGGDPLRGISAFLEAVAVGLVFSVFAALPPRLRPARPVVVGVVAGLAVTALASAVQVAGATGASLGATAAGWVPWGPDPLLYPGRAAGWLDHPNVWAARVVLPAVLVAGVWPRPTLVVAAQGLAWITVLASGSRSAAAALLVGTVVALVLGHLRRRAAPAASGARRPAEGFARAVPALVLGGLLIGASLAVVATPAGTRFDVRLAAAGEGRAASPRNLLRASEDLETDRVAWKLQGVTVDAAPGPWSGGRSFRVTKETGAPDARVYAEIGLEPGTTYTLSFAHGPGDAATVPGVAGWGRTSEDDPHHTLNVRRVGGTWSARTAGDVTAGPVRVDGAADGWERVSVSFAYGGEDRVTWRVGPTPDQRPAASGGSMLVSELQLERGREPSAYAPTRTEDRVAAVAAEAVASRAAIFEEAWRGFLEHPFTGVVGAGSRAATGGASLTTARHGHNLLLAPLHERGAAGGAAVLALVLAIAVAGRRGGAVAAGVLVAVVGLNTVDYTFWTAGVAYPMAAAVGWSVSRSLGVTPEP